MGKKSGSILKLTTMAFVLYLWAASMSLQRTKQYCLHIEFVVIFNNASLSIGLSYISCMMLLRCNWLLDSNAQVPHLLVSVMGEGVQHWFNICVSSAQKNQCFWIGKFYYLSSRKLKYASFIFDFGQKSCSLFISLIRLVYRLWSSIFSVRPSMLYFSPNNLLAFTFTCLFVYSIEP